MNVIRDRIIPITVCLVIIISIITIPALAFNESGTTRVNPRTSQPIIATSTNEYTLNITSQTFGQWIFIADNYNTSGNTIVFMVSDSNPGANISWTGDTQGSSGVSTVNYFYTENSVNYYYGIFNNIFGTPITYYVPHIDCQASPDSLDICKNYFAEGLSYSLDYWLPAGNVAYIKLTSSFNGFVLNATMPTSSYLFGGNNLFTGANQYYGFTSTLPNTGSYTPIGSRINWLKDTSSGVSITGQTRNAYFESTGPYPNETYLVIYNPAYYGETDNGPYEFLNNPSIRIRATGVSNIQVFSLTSEMKGSSSGGIQVDTNINGDNWTGELNENDNTIDWTSTTNSDTEPTSGGGNLTTTSNTINDWLKNISQQISQFFNGAIDAINILINAIANFTNTLKSLYMWLPSPVYSLLTSAIMLAITIGVIKVFI